jgi:hypothetical protein
MKPRPKRRPAKSQPPRLSLWERMQQVVEAERKAKEAEADGGDHAGREGGATRRSG